MQHWACRVRIRSALAFAAALAVLLSLNTHGWSQSEWTSSKKAASAPMAASSATDSQVQQSAAQVPILVPNTAASPAPEIIGPPAIPRVDLPQPAQQINQADLEKRVKELERRISAINGSVEGTSNEESAGEAADAASPEAIPTALPGAAKSGTPAAAADNKTSRLPLTSGWSRSNGFFIASPDGQNRVRLTGQIQSDYRAYLDPNDRIDNDAFTVRRARIGVDANVFQFHEFRYLIDFGSGSLNGNNSITTVSRIVDAYYNMHYWNEFQIEAGKFKQPFSYEQLIQDRFTPFMERSLIDQLVPQRDVGIMFHGQNLLDGRVDYGLSVSNGEQNGDTDTNDDKDYVFRTVVRPLRGFVPCFDNFQLGMSYGTGIEQESTANFILRTPAGIPFFNFLPTVRANGLRNRYSPEVAYFLGGFGFLGQWFHMEQQFEAPNGRTNILVPFDGYFLQASYLLTGETRTAYTNVEPLIPFDPRGGSFGWGAWELVARMSRLHASDDVFFVRGAQLANPNGLSNAATEMTLGFNWYLNGFVRFQFNWEHSWFDRPVQLGPGSYYSYANALMTRLQIQF